MHQARGAGSLFCSGTNRDKGVFFLSRLPDPGWPGVFGWKTGKKEFPNPQPEQTLMLCTSAPCSGGSFSPTARASILLFLPTSSKGSALVVVGSAPAGASSRSCSCRWDGSIGDHGPCWAAAALVQVSTAAACHTAPVGDIHNGHLLLPWLYCENIDP